MGSLRLDKPHVAINTTTRIPTAVGLVSIIHSHGNYVVALLVEVRCEVVLERTITIGTSAQVMSIDIHRGIHIHTIEGDGILVIFLLRTDGEVLAIPTDAPRQGSPTRPRRIRRREVALYRPIVRQIEMSPCQVGIVVLLHSHTISEGKEPPLIEIQSLSSLHWQSCKGEQTKRYQRLIQFHNV